MFDEMTQDGQVRDGYQAVADWLKKADLDDLAVKRAEAEAIFRRMGITFAVYGDGGDLNGSSLSTLSRVYSPPLNGTSSSEASNSAQKR